MEVELRLARRDRNLEERKDRLPRGAIRRGRRPLAALHIARDYCWEAREPLTGAKRGSRTGAAYDFFLRCWPRPAFFANADRAAA